MSRPFFQFLEARVERLTEELRVSEEWRLESRYQATTSVDPSAEAPRDQNMHIIGEVGSALDSEDV